MKKTISIIISLVFAFSVTYIMPARSGLTPVISVSAEEKMPLPYMYESLTDVEKDIYDQMREAVIKCKLRYTADRNITSEQFDRVWEIIAYYDSYTFNVKWMSLQGREVKIGYAVSKASFDKMLESIDKTAAAVIARLDDKMTDYEKIMYIHDYIAKNTVYEIEAKYSHMAYGALVSKKAKCDGIAKAFAYICEKAGFNVTTVPGYTTREGNEGHMWNKIEYGGEWYVIDVTNAIDNDTFKNSIIYDFYMISDFAYGSVYLEDELFLKLPEATDDGNSYYALSKLLAGSVSDAEKIITDEVTNVVKNKKTNLSVQFESQTDYEAVKKALFDDDGIYDVFKTARRRSTSSRLADVYIYQYNDDMLTIRIYVFYRNTSLASYFVNPDEFGKENLAVLRSYGIK